MMNWLRLGKQYKGASDDDDNLYVKLAKTLTPEQVATLLVGWGVTDYMIRAEMPPEIFPKQTAVMTMVAGISLGEETVLAIRKHVDEEAASQGGPEIVAAAKRERKEMMAEVQRRLGLQEEESA